MKLEGKTVAITGSTRGIGKSLADGFAQAGAHVVVHGRSLDDAVGVAKDIGGTAVAADLATEEGCLWLANEISQRFDKLDILINNAGMETIMPIGEIENTTMEQIVQVNLLSPVRLIEALLTLLRASGGASVINMTSIHQSTPYPHNAVYSMTKAGLAMYTKTAAVELAPQGIRVNNFAPGVVETDINREVVEYLREQFAEWIPAGRCAHVDEMVGPAIFLACEDSSYITGTTLYADGGYSQNLVRYRP